MLSFVLSVTVTDKALLVNALYFSINASYLDVFINNKRIMWVA